MIFDARICFLSERAFFGKHKESQSSSMPIPFALLAVFLLQDASQSSALSDSLRTLNVDQSSISLGNPAVFGEIQNRVTFPFWIVTRGPLPHRCFCRSDLLSACNDLPLPLISWAINSSGSTPGLFETRRGSEEPVANFVWGL